MNIFSMKAKKTENIGEEVSPSSEEETSIFPRNPQDEPVYDEDGYDQNGFDRDGYSRNGYNAKGYRRNIGEPLSASVKLEDEILKYRRADGYFEYEMAVYANFADLKENFESNREDIAELIYNLFLIDEGRALRLWKWLLESFESTLSEPANAYRLTSGILHALERSEISSLLPCLQKDARLGEFLFGKSSYIDRTQAALLASCIGVCNYDLFQMLIDFLLSNPYVGHEGTLSTDKILKTVIEEIPARAMTHEGNDLLVKYIKKSRKMMMRKVLLKLLDGKMEYLLKEEKRKKAESERAARLEQQKLRLEEERKSHQKETGARQKLRTTKKKYGELKISAIAERKQNPFFEGGRFIDFQQLEGTVVALKEHPELPAQLLPGDRLELRREPYYLQDPMAIAVTDIDGMKIGYIPNHSNTFLALLMDEGHEIFCKLYSIGSEDADSLQICVELFMKE